MKVLITGGAGFIGSYLVKYWLKIDPGVRIVNLDKLTYSGDLGRLKEVKNHPRYQFIRGDVADARCVERAMPGCEAVVHVAAETHVDRSLLDAKSFFDSNIHGTYVLLEAARRHGIRKFLLVSTDEVYGSVEKGFSTESSPLEPTSPYSISKTAGDWLAFSYAHTYGLHAMITRGGNTFGPYQYPEKVIPLFVSQALQDEPLPLYGDGRQVRNWIFVEDHVQAILHVLKKGKKGEAYNVSGRTYLKNIDLTKKILKLLGKPASLVRRVQDRPGHDRRYAMSSAKLRALGWRERFPFEKALAESVRWYCENKRWWRAIKEKSKDFKDYYKKSYQPKMR